MDGNDGNIDAGPLAAGAAGAAGEAGAAGAAVAGRYKTCCWKRANTPLLLRNIASTTSPRNARLIGSSGFT